MRYIYFTGGNGYCGCDIDEVSVFPDDTTDEELDQYAYEMAIDNAETYEYVATGWDEGWESEEAEDLYYQDSYCNWVEITEEEYKEMKGDS